jgi:predicted metalloprotease with PDZ domain
MPDELPPDAPAPRLCHLIKWHDFDGYGFNLHAEKSKTGQFVGKVDDQSPAQAAGLREGDRIIEVNGVNIVCENHRQVCCPLFLSHPSSRSVAM